MRPWIVVASLSLSPQAALACGGFFCDSSQPIDQTKERIVFDIDDVENKVEVHVQIYYQGSAPEFSWVVPVPAVPEIRVTSDYVFEVLDRATVPTFYRDTRTLGECDDTAFDSAYADTAGGGGLGGGSFDTAGPAAPTGVTVVAQTQVGPYDQVTLQASDPVALTTWLTENGYAVPPTVGAALAPYVSSTGYFVALKLQNDRDSGDIAPIAMRYDGTVASIPLVLTSVAAQPDMRIVPFILHRDKRAIPDNYLHVVINDAAIHWMSGGENYDDVVTVAANEAGGQAFTTDYAGIAGPMLNYSFVWAERASRAELERATDPAAFIQLLLQQGFPTTQAMQELLRQYIPMPADAVATGISEANWYNCVACFPGYAALVPFDPVAFTAALWEQMVVPSNHMKALLTAHPYVTRLSSSMSAAEMTSDALFTVATGLGEQTNVYQAQLWYDCTNGPVRSAAPRWILTPSGVRVDLPSEDALAASGGTDGGVVDALGLPGARLIEDLSADGSRTTLTDNSARIAALASPSTAPAERVDTTEPSTPGAGPTGCGCDGTGGTAGAMALAGSLLLRRRRS
jgi:uncharacterized protein (TIGR03382 family)